jgi:hypothetical protein
LEIRNLYIRRVVSHQYMILVLSIGFYVETLVIP